MWQRLGEVCEELASADVARTRELWGELHEGEVLERACRAALTDGQAARPVLARCLDWLQADGLPERVETFSEEMNEGRWWRDADSLIRDIRKEIEGAILAAIALRCAAGEPCDDELLLWASRLCRWCSPASSGLVPPARADRPVAWIEACVLPLAEANSAFAQQNGRDLLRRLLRFDLSPARERLHSHDLEAFLRGARREQTAALQRLLRDHHLRDVRDLSSVLDGSRPDAEVPLDLVEWCRFSDEDLVRLTDLVTSEDVRVRLIALVFLGEGLVPCTPCLESELDSDPLQIPTELPDSLSIARSDSHPVVAALAVCALAQIVAPSPAAEMAAQVAGLLRDARAIVRAAAARAVGCMPGGAAWSGDLAPLLADPATTVRLEAAMAVGRLGPQAATPAVLTSLLPLFDDADAGVRREAITAAAVLGPALTDAHIDRLTALTRSAGEVVRMDSVQALGATGGRAARPAVFAALAARFDDLYCTVREYALRAYADLGGPPNAALVARVVWLHEQDRTASVREAAAYLLARQGCSEPRPDDNPDSARG